MWRKAGTSCVGGIYVANMRNSMRKTVNLKIELSFDLGIPFLGSYSWERKALI